MAIPPILSAKHYEAPSVFTAQNLLREARRTHVPRCQLDNRCPFRETATAIEYALAEGLLAVEMEAAALYAFAQARAQRVVCFAHVTNQLGRIEGDFEQGNADGIIS